MNPKRTTTQPGFTLIELLVVVSIISMLTAIILPAIGKVKQQAKRTACQANLHAVAIAFKMYLDDYRDHTPNAADMPSLEPTRGKKSITTYMEPYLSDKRSLQCPADTPGAFDRIEQPQKTYFETEKSSYIYNSKLNGMRIKDYIASATNHPRHPQKITERELEIIWDYRPFHGPEDKTYSTNYLYADLHVAGGEKQ